MTEEELYKLKLKDMPERLQRCAKTIEKDYQRKVVFPKRTIVHAQPKTETHPEFFMDLFTHIKELKESPEFFDRNMLYECYVNLVQAEMWYLKATNLD